MKIDHILTLSRLKIKGKEKEELEKEFSSILDFVKKLQKLDVRDVKPMAYPIDLKNIFREDKVLQIINYDRQTRKLLDLAPETQKRHIKAKQIL